MTAHRCRCRPGILDQSHTNTDQPKTADRSVTPETGARNRQAALPNLGKATAKSATVSNSA